MKILYQDDELVVVDKPSGYHVHAPEDRPNAETQNVVLTILRNQLQKWVYPVHRLDRATSGVLLFALNPTIARELQMQFQDQTVGKIYLALVRGWTNDAGEIASPLTRRLEGGAEAPALTTYETIFRFELTETVGKFSTARYSLVKVAPLTGRLHQIRRHFKRISHPIIGDTVHGDGKHNQLWRKLIPHSGLFLKAYRLSFTQPRTRQTISVHSNWNNQWHQLFDLIGTCPFDLHRKNQQA